ncbi:MAG TPA: hypothetical protein PKJ97_02580, partial [Candidatus Bilamarchaeaceae archaeon]|nr:hypothetical protein [Candidatus Bilamarchaeaceae archaeon]
GSLQLKEVAERLLNYTEDYGEWEEYAQTGRELYEEGKYAGAVYELAFAKGMIEGDLIAEEGGDCISELAAGNGTGVWGKVFRGHARYMEETGSREDACRMAAFSREMDRIASEIAGEERGENVPELPEDSLCLPAFVVLGMCCAALFAGEVLKN